jgi:hypothetical protein
VKSQSETLQISEEAIKVFQKAIPLPRGHRGLCREHSLFEKEKTTMLKTLFSRRVNDVWL